MRLNVLQVDQGKESAGQLGRGTSHFLIRELFPIQLTQDREKRLGWGGVDSWRRASHRHELEDWNVDGGAEVSAMWLQTPDLPSKSC